MITQKQLDDLVLALYQSSRSAYLDKGKLKLYKKYQVIVDILQDYAEPNTMDDLDKIIEEGMRL